LLVRPACGRPPADSIERRDYIFETDFAPVLAAFRTEYLPRSSFINWMAWSTLSAQQTAGPPPLAAGIDAPIEHTFLASKFIYTGTLDKYPNLQFVLPHAAGAFPYLVDASTFARIT